MPMSADFEARLFPRLPGIIRHFGTPFHVFDEKGILETGESLKQTFRPVTGFREFYAVKALPNPTILARAESLAVAPIFFVPLYY